ncbi:Ldh family oxidoreductase [Candidatus Roizmanbacteria bacterium]|nr:Ldh family oxidoreductase [Candidatus Roizmanbacteria bacterium]
MKIKVSEANQISQKFLEKLGLSPEESTLITENVVDAELAGRKTHGFVRLISFKKQSDEKRLNIDALKLDIIDESPVHIHIDGHGKLGYGVIYKSLDLAFEKIKTSRMVSVRIKDLGVTGYIGGYARKATEKDLIFIGFNNSPGGLVPYGSKKELWGTNPMTIGVPTEDTPVILDMASTLTTWGELMVAKNEGREIKPGVAIDADGKPTTDPVKAMSGGLLPFAGYKGSGLGLIVELLAGALTGARVGYAVPGGWGSFYILIDPTLFRPLADFKKDIKAAITELKNAPKMDGVEEIYFPGEQSHRLRQEQLSGEMVDISDKILEQVRSEL